MGFVAPLMLAGASAVTVPIALHFFYKARHRPLPWAAMRFLRQSIEQTSKRLKFQEWVLLALRCLALILLALAMARPSCAPVAGGVGESVDAVLLFDLSYSMGARDGEAFRLDRAKAAALGVLDSLPPNSTAQVVGVSDRATALGPISPGNLDEARRVVGELKLTALAGDILPGLAEALAALDRGQGSHKEVYVFSDLQKSGWDRQAGAVRAKAAEIQARAAVTLVRCGADRPLKNVMIADLSFPGTIPHTDPQRPTRLPVTLILKNSGPEPVRNLSLTLEVEGKGAEKETKAIEEVGPGESLPVTLTARLDRAGSVRLSATLSGDELPGDDRLDRLVPVREQLRVLVIDGAPSSRDPKQSASHFVVNALVPVPENRRDDYFVRVTVARPEEARGALLGAADVCILCNVPLGPGGVGRDFLERLAVFVKEGGGVIVGGGSNVKPEAYNPALGAAGLDLLPFDLAGAIRGSAEKPLRADPESAESPGFLARFREEPFRTVTAEAEFLEVVAPREGARPGSRTILKLSDGTPLVTARPAGGGEVIFVGAPLDASRGNWPAKAGSFVSFLQYTLAHLAGRGSRGGNVTAGTPLVVHPTEAPRPFEVTRPDGSVRRLGKATGGGDERLTVTVADTDLAGIYRVGLEGSSGSSPDRFAVAPDLRESDDLRPASDDELEALLGFRPAFAAAGADASGLFRAERSRQELTVWLLLALFGVACAETAWAWLCGRAW